MRIIGNTRISTYVVPAIHHIACYTNARTPSRKNYSIQQRPPQISADSWNMVRVVKSNEKPRVDGSTFCPFLRIFYACIFELPCILFLFLKFYPLLTYQIFLFFHNHLRE